MRNGHAYARTLSAAGLETMDQRSGDCQEDCRELSSLLSARLQRLGNEPWVRTQDADGEARRAQPELEAILRGCAAAPTEPAAPAVMFGVSPPTRGGCCGGAANPLAHDGAWARSAYSASHMSLQALRELESAGVSFLGNSDILVGSPPVHGAVPGLVPEPLQRPKANPGGGCNPNSMMPFQCNITYFAV